ncbi:hypothetical protein BCSJ1_26268, partial [Bacillus cereus SJ1]
MRGDVGVRWSWFLLALLGAGQHGDGAGHASLVVAGDQAGKVKAPGAVEVPHDIAGLARRHVGHVGLVVFHAGVLFHHFGVGVQLGLGADHDLVQHLA